MPVPTTRLRPACLTALLATVLATAGAAQAQGVQRIVGPDGRVTYSDRVGSGVPAAPAAAPSSPSTPPATAAGNTAGNAAPLDTGALPFALRGVVQRYPVTLYTRDNCATCVSARELLLKRGVPFVEKTIGSSADAEAFARLGAENVLPLMTIGRQRVSGFRESEVTQYLDAAGYPGQSQLPRTYRNPPAAPLAGAANGNTIAGASANTTGSDTTSSVDLPQAPSRPVAPAVTPPAAPANPAGIRF